MLSGADLDKILDDGYGDAGFNDPVLEVEERAPGKPAASPSAFKFADGAPKPAAGTASAPAQPAESEKQLPKPYERPAVSGATPPPPPGGDPAAHELSMALDQAARGKGYKNAEEYNKYLEQSGALQQPDMSEMNETPLAPGIKKAPAYMPPGAYPGDRTKLGKDWEKEHGPVVLQGRQPEDGFTITYVKQSDRPGYARVNDGNTITFRLDGSENIQTAEVGGSSIPWALDEACRKMKVGDIADVSGRGEHAFADTEGYVPDAQRTWRFEFVSIEGRSYDKFSMATDERVERANSLRLRGNDMFKKQRLRRALNYYERGSSLMDVLEAEELGMPGKPDAKAAEMNRRIWECQKPLLLNWALILMKLGRWEEAERKCTEVLMDIDKLNVKALFRRGQCNLHLGNHEIALTDLRRAAELDTSLEREVEKELEKVAKLRKVVDKGDQPMAKKVVEGLLKEPDARSEAPPPRQPQARPEPTELLINTLKAQEANADEQNIDEDTYCRQREAIYGQFLTMAPREAAED